MRKQTHQLMWLIHVSLFWQFEIVKPLILFLQYIPLIHNINNNQFTHLPTSM